MKKTALYAIASALFSISLAGMNCGPSPTGAKTKIAITGPAEGQKVCAGDTQLVSWTQSVSNAKISYNFNRGGGWVEFASVTKVDDNSAKAVLPVTSYTDSFQIKVEDNGGTFDAGTSGLVSLKYIVISSPAAGSTLTQGSTVAIRFKACTAKISSLRFMLSTDDGKSYGDMLATSVDPSLTSFDWVIGSEAGAGAPFGYPSSKCILKIRDYNNDQLRDLSGTFSVQ
jgi:hypothetical protein